MSVSSSIPMASRVRSSCFRRLVRVCGFTLAAWALTVVGADAQGSPGIRVGLGLDPDFFVIGAHVESNPLVDRLRFRPNLEVGLGDDLTLIAINAEFAYWFPSRRPWSLYAGGGPAINIYRFGDRGRRESDLEPGFNVMLGLAHRQGLFTEFKIGALDSPELRLTVGFAFN